MKTRHAYVAGKFFPSYPTEIDRLLDSIFRREKERINYKLSNRQITGGVVPHAGYIYSGYQAVHFFELVRASAIEYETVVIIHPNHTGYGLPISIDSNDRWESPDGYIPVDKTFAEEMGLTFSDEAHRFEHACEVMLPWLSRFMLRPFKIVPVSMLVQSPVTARMVANGITEAISKTGQKVLVIASSDFSHYVTPSFGFHQDEFVLDKILRMEVDGVYEEVRKHKVTICGYGPVMALMEYSRMSSQNPGVHLLARGHSGEIHFSEEVVDYMSILFTG
jgi:MEMO1 family protein